MLGFLAAMLVWSVHSEYLDRINYMELQSKIVSSETELAALGRFAFDPEALLTGKIRSTLDRETRTIDMIVRAARTRPEDTTKAGNPANAADPTSLRRNDLGSIRELARMLSAASKAWVSGPNHSRGIQALSAPFGICAQLAFDREPASSRLCRAMLALALDQLDAAAAEGDLGVADCAVIASHLAWLNSEDPTNSTVTLRTWGLAWADFFSAARVEPPSGPIDPFEWSPYNASAAPFRAFRTASEPQWMKWKKELDDALREISGAVMTYEKDPQAVKLLCVNIAEGRRGEIARAVYSREVMGAELHSVIAEAATCTVRLRDVREWLEQVSHGNAEPDSRCKAAAAMIRRIVVDLENAGAVLDGQNNAQISQSPCRYVDQEVTKKMLARLVSDVDRLEWRQWMYWRRRGETSVDYVARTLVVLKALYARAECMAENAKAEETAEAMIAWLHMAERAMEDFSVVMAPRVYMMVCGELERNNLPVTVAARARAEIRARLAKQLDQFGASEGPTFAAVVEFSRRRIGAEFNAAKMTALSDQDVIALAMVLEYAHHMLRGGAESARRACVVALSPTRHLGDEWDQAVRMAVVLVNQSAKEAEDVIASCPDVRGLPLDLQARRTEAEALMRRLAEQVRAGGAGLPG